MRDDFDNTYYEPMTPHQQDIVNHHKQSFDCNMSFATDSTLGIPPTTSTKIASQQNNNVAFASNALIQQMGFTQNSNSTFKTPRTLAYPSGVDASDIIARYFAGLLRQGAFVVLEDSTNRTSHHIHNEDHSWMNNTHPYGNSNDTNQYRAMSGPIGGSIGGSSMATWRTQMSSANKQLPNIQAQKHRDYSSQGPDEVFMFLGLDTNSANTFFYARHIIASKIKRDKDMLIALSISHGSTPVTIPFSSISKIIYDSPQGLFPVE